MQHSAHSLASGGNAIDPVCGMTVDSVTTAFQHTHNNHTEYFCSAGCRSKFAADPEKYRESAGAAVRHAPEEATTGAVFTCPMHPEVRQDGPGSCPICGMALEPELPGSDDGGERADMQRRFWIAAVLTLPIVLLDMSDHLGGHWRLAGAAGALANFAQLILATPVVLWAGWPFFVRAAQSLVSRNLNMFTLVAMSTAVAYGYSVVAVLAPHLFPAAFRDGHGGVALYFEAASVIVVLVLLGQILELRARASTSSAIGALIDLTPKVARRVNADGGDEDVPIETIAVGDRLRIRPGENIPVDGVILAGRSTVDQSMLTGEATPAAKLEGDKVVAGTLNQSGSFIMRAEKVGRDTMLAHIVRMVADAQRSRAPIQKLVDRVAAWFVPAVIAVAVLAFMAWAAFGPQPRFAYALVAAVTVLIIACPCALGLATPMSIMVGVGRAAQAGILVKSAQALERMAKVDTLVVDKTGTLTEGKPKVTAIVTAPGCEEIALIRFAASVERASEHPLAAAIVAAAAERSVVPLEVSDFDAAPGKGVRGRVEGHRIVLGNAGFLAESGVSTAALDDAAKRQGADGATVILVAVDGHAFGLIAVIDPVKPTTFAALQALAAQQIEIVMLTGDGAAAARVVARKLGIARIEAEVLPQRKSAVIEELRRAGRVVAMAGDGSNDAPALAAADVGIAMGDGTAIALASADMTLVKGDLNGIVRARALSAATMRNIGQNLLFASLYNAASVPIAAGALYPVFGILLSPAIGAAAMALSSVAVVVNALRLRRVSL